MISFDKLIYLLKYVHQITLQDYLY